MKQTPLTGDGTRVGIIPVLLWDIAVVQNVSIHHASTSYSSHPIYWCCFVWKAIDAPLTQALRTCRARSIVRRVHPSSSNIQCTSTRREQVYSYRTVRHLNNDRDASGVASQIRNLLTTRDNLPPGTPHPLTPPVWRKTYLLLLSRFSSAEDDGSRR